MRHLNIRSLALVSTLALCVAAPAQAQRREARNPHQGSSAVLGEVGLFLPTQDGMTSGPAVDGAYEYYLTARNSLRLGVGWANPKLDREHSDGTRQVRVGGDLVHNWEGGAIHPFVGAGAGSYFLQPIDNGNSFGPSETKLGARLLGGVEYLHFSVFRDQRGRALRRGDEGQRLQPVRLHSVDRDQELLLVIPPAVKDPV